MDHLYEVVFKSMSEHLQYENVVMRSNGQFSCGDQTKECRSSFAESDFKICPKCHSTEIDTKVHGANCRMNGDAFGTDVFTCKLCNWITSFQWDEGGDYPYYYEIIYFDYYKEEWEKIQKIQREEYKQMRESREERGRKSDEDKNNI